jgi:hypothetical protein
VSNSQELMVHKTHLIQNGVASVSKKLILIPQKPMRFSKIKNKDGEIAQMVPLFLITSQVQLKL